MKPAHAQLVCWLAFLFMLFFGPLHQSLAHRTDEAGEHIKPVIGDSGTRLLHDAPGRNRRDIQVLMVPGPGFNSRLFELKPDDGLVGTLTSRGYHVWRLEPVWDEGGDGSAFSSSLANFVEEDVEAALREILKTGPNTRIVLLGHGLGATLIAGYLEKGSVPEVVGAVLIAPIFGLGHPSRVVQHFVEDAVGNGIDLSVRLFDPVPEMVGEDYFGILMTALAPGQQEMLRQSIRPALGWVPSGVVGELSEWGGKGCCPLGSHNLLTELATIRTPVLVLSGVADNIAAPEDVLEGVRRIGSQDRSYRMLSVTNFYGMDYGHLDLLGAPQAPRDTYPLILKWLKGKRNRKFLVDSALR